MKSLMDKILYTDLMEASSIDIILAQISLGLFNITLAADCTLYEKKALLYIMEICYNI
jgi:hypothetical protein